LDTFCSTKLVDCLLQDWVHAYEGQQGRVEGALTVGGIHRVAAALVPREIVFASRQAGSCPAAGLDL
jgi:hypothetical protein